MGLNVVRMVAVASAEPAGPSLSVLVVFASVRLTVLAKPAATMVVVALAAAATRA